jgi:formate dehydrogenase subunit gamma
VTVALTQRFDRVTRAVHWSTAALGLVVLVTGTVLYVPELSAVVGMRATLKDIHVIAGLLVLVPLAVAAASGPAGRRLRADLAELSRIRVSSGKFNDGQKFLTAVFSGLFVMQLLTGLLMFRPNAFPDAWRTGATFVHDWAYIGLFLATAGHIFKAISEPELLQSMMTGEGPSRRD